jgi:hypothetical protein
MFMFMFMFMFMLMLMLMLVIVSAHSSMLRQVGEPSYSSIYENRWCRT